MLARIPSVTVIGLTCFPVEIEIQIIGGLPQFIIIGLGDTAVQESKERVKLAIKNSGFQKPGGKIVCNLAPADMKKFGPGFDIPIAVGLLTASGQVQNTSYIEESMFIGELALSGDTRHVSSIISISQYAKHRGFKRIFVPACNGKEASMISGIEIIPVLHLKELIMHLKGIKKISVMPPSSIPTIIQNEKNRDFKYVQGQKQAKRALEIAAAGSHNLLFQGSPGSGKTLMARCLQGILPKLTKEEALEVSKVYSSARLLSEKEPFIAQRPFRVVHHTASHISIIGGGKIPKPGEVSLAHKGVLFLDELGEFPNYVLEVLRQPLEDRTITINRVQCSLTYPAQFMLVAAMNPCPCGYNNVPESKKECTCTQSQIQRYHENSQDRC